MVNYQNGKIYTIRCRSDDTLIYVGSTTQKLSQRMTIHRSDCKRGMGCSLYDYIVSDDWSEWYIELYEMYPCNSKEELEKKEGEIIRQIATINKRINGRTKKEWCEDNPEYFKEYRENNAEKLKETNKKWREDNIEKVKETKKKYYEDNVEYLKEKTKKWREENAEKIKETKKKYYEDNVEYLKEKTKKWREENAEKIKEEGKEKVCCDICGTFIRKNGLTIHQKSKKCTDEKSKN